MGLNDANARLIAELMRALLPLAVSDDNNPPPGVAVDDWREAVTAARAAVRHAQRHAQL